jgi:hypothetical protein
VGAPTTSGYRDGRNQSVGIAKKRFPIGHRNLGEKMKSFNVRIEIIIQAHDENKAYENVHNCLMPGVSTADIQITEVTDEELERRAIG